MKTRVVDKDFLDEFQALTQRLKRRRFTAKQISAVLHITPCMFSKWYRGEHAPIWLARQAALFILRELDRSSLRS